MSSTHGHRSHMLWMLLCCLVPLLALGLVYGLGLSTSRVVTTGLLLLCPLSHLLMMGRMAGRHGAAHDENGEVIEGTYHEQQAQEGGQIQPQVAAEGSRAEPL